MSLLWKRVCLVIMFLVSAVTGCWAYAAPHMWYENFPGLGLRWLPQLGPYNEHLASDVGALFAALAVLCAITLRRVRNRLLVSVTGAVLLAFNVLHLIYHMTMLHMYNTLDKTLNVVSAILLVLVSVVLVVPTRQEQERESRH